MVGGVQPRKRLIAPSVEYRNGWAANDGAIGFGRVRRTERSAHQARFGLRVYISGDLRSWMKGETDLAGVGQWGCSTLWECWKA